MKKALIAGDCMNKWSQTKWAKKIAAKEAKKSLTDIERFKLMLAKKKVAHGVKTALKVRKAKKWASSESS